MSKVNITENGKNLVFYDEVLLPFENVYCMQLYCIITTSLRPKRKVAPATVSYFIQRSEIKHAGFDQIMGIQIRPYTYPTQPIE